MTGSGSCAAGGATLPPFGRGGAGAGRAEGIAGGPLGRIGGGGARLGGLAVDEELPTFSGGGTLGDFAAVGSGGGATLGGRELVGTGGGPALTFTSTALLLGGRGGALTLGEVVDGEVSAPVGRGRGGFGASAMLPAGYQE